MGNQKTLARKRELENRRKHSEGWREVFRQLRNNHPEDWVALYLQANQDRDEARRLLRAKYPDEFHAIYTKVMKSMGITPRPLQKEGVAIQTQTHSNIVIKSAQPLEPQTDFTKLGYTLIAKEPMPSPSGGVFNSMSKVLFADNQDGTSLEAVGCNKCFMLFKNLQGTAHHIGKVHNGKSGKRKPMKKKSYSKPTPPTPQATTPAVSVTPIISAGIDPVKAITDLVAQRQYWEAQAKAYEAQLNAIRQAFTGK
jgi:uncharacterized C2H2 Zn-finger protein